MKVQDLLEREWEETGLGSFVGNKPKHAFSKAVNAQRAKPNHQYVGSGSYAYVSRDTSPHEMDNVNRFSRGEDGTAAFYKWLEQNPHAAKNRFFPRVLQHTTTEDGFNDAKIERLYPFKSPKLMTLPMMTSLWEELFNGPVPEFAQGETGAYDLALEIVDVIDKTVKGRRTSTSIKDPELEKAVAYLRQARSGSPDIHDDNVMWRITGTKPQLVITDPFT